MQLAEAYQLVLIEDACQAHAASIDEKPVGSFGTGCFSFYATKNITTGEGGIVTTNDPEIAERVRLLRSHGQRERYYHTALGYNMRMTEIQGALGLVQLEKLEQFTRQRIANAMFLTEHLHGHVQTPETRPGCRHVYHQYTIQVPSNRDEWAVRLRARGIGTAVHYQLAIHQQPFYRDHLDAFRLIDASQRSKGKGSTGEAHLPVTEKAAAHVLSLPVHPGLSEDDLSMIIQEVRTLCE